MDDRARYFKQNHGHYYCQEVGMGNDYLPNNLSPQKKFSYDEEYNFSHKKRGIAVIINNDSFGDPDLPKREGSHHDTVKLEECFNKLGFDSRILVNVTKFEMIQHLKYFATELSKDQDFDCLVLAISSHGEEVKKKYDTMIITEDVVNCTDDVVPINDVLSIFSDVNCPGLIDKPRLCFIQICRGYNLDPGVDIKTGGVSSLEAIDSTMGNFRQCEFSLSRRIVKTPFPCMKDFLVMFASPPGHHAFRRQKEGSWFITALTSVLGSLNAKCTTKCSIHKLLTRVNNLVANFYESKSKDPAFSGKKQTTCIYSMLTKSLYLNPK